MLFSNLASIPIHVASEAYSPLLHGFKANQAYDGIKDCVFDSSRLQRSPLTLSRLLYVFLLLYALYDGHHAFIQNCLLSAASQFDDWAASEAYAVLADKLWTASGYKKLDPATALTKVG